MIQMLTLLPGLILIGIGVYFLYPVLLSFMALGAVIVLLFFVVFIPLIILIKIFGFNPDNDKHAKTAKYIFIYTTAIGTYLGIAYFIFSWIRVLI